MQIVACTKHHALGKVWREHRCARALFYCVSCVTTALSNDGVGVRPLFCPVLLDCGRRCARVSGGKYTNCCFFSFC